MVSDGSDIDGTMTFGWVISTPRGHRLATCAGPGFGRGSSHIAEGFGTLSVGRFIYHLLLFCSVSTPQKGRFLLDNKGLITRIWQ